MNSPSAAPRPTTLVSPVTISTSGRPGGLRHVGDDARGAPRPGSPLRSRTPPTATPGSAPCTARSFTVPCTARWPIEPPGKRSGCTTNESVLNARRSPLGERQRRGVGQRPGLAVDERIEEHGIDQRGRGLAAGAVGERHDVVAQPRAAAAELGDAVEHRRLAVVGPAAGRRQSPLGYRPRDSQVRLHPEPERDPSAACVSWMRWTLSSRTTKQAARGRSRPSRRRRSRRRPIVSKPRRAASSNAASRLRELPLVEMPTAMSSGAACAMS